jgi:hypothetical protein
VLIEAGHIVIFLRDCIATGSPDDLVCVAAEENQAILVACDGDMKQMVKKFGVSNGRFKKLSLVKISCKSPQAAARMKSALSLVQHEWNFNSESAVRRLYVEIKSATISTNR